MMFVGEAKVVQRKRKLSEGRVSVAGRNNLLPSEKVSTDTVPHNEEPNRNPPAIADRSNQHTTRSHNCKHSNDSIYHFVKSTIIIYTGIGKYRDKNRNSLQLPAR